MVKILEDFCGDVSGKIDGVFETYFIGMKNLRMLKLL